MIAVFTGSKVYLIIVFIGYVIKDIGILQFACSSMYSITSTFSRTGPRSADGNVSDYRCVSDCRSRGREFDPGPVPYFRGD